MAGTRAALRSGGGFPALRERADACPAGGRRPRMRTLFPQAAGGMRLPARRGRDDAGSDRADCRYKIPQSRAERPPFGRKGGFSAAGRTKSTLFKSAAGRIPRSVSVSRRRRIVRAHTKRSIKPDEAKAAGGRDASCAPIQGAFLSQRPFRRAALRKCRGTAAAAVPLKMFLSHRSRRPFF